MLRRTHTCVSRSEIEFLTILSGSEKPPGHASDRYRHGNNEAAAAPCDQQHDRDRRTTPLDADAFPQSDCASG